jgi:hypothetical protein
MKPKIDQKTLLAKLFASENIKIRHSTEVKTAYFDVKNRLLCLPLWKDITNELYNLLISHEVGHALYTPLDCMEKIVEKGQIYKSLFNIIEDVRIEKMIQKKFPGLRRDYYKGYADLIDRGIFDIDGKKVREDAGKYDFINRINLHFKLKDHINVPFFDSREKDIIRRVDSCETIEDVIKLTDELFEELADEIEKLKQEAEESSGEGTGEEGEGEGSGGEADETIEVEELDVGGESDSMGEFSGRIVAKKINNKKGKKTKNSSGTSKTSSPSIVSLNKFDMERISEELTNTKVGKVTYVKMPSDKILDKFIVPNKKLVEEVREYGVGESDVKINQLTDKKMVNYMHKIFEQKKAASDYRKISISKSGIIDTNKLHQYKIKDDLFLRSSIYQDGKNHGVIMLVDFSGSMSGVLENVILQVLELMEFCRKSRIKYKIFSFTSGYYLNTLSRNDYSESDIVLDRKTILVELFNSEMGLKDRDLIIASLRNFCQGQNQCRYITMGGTPLVSSMIAMNTIIKKFRAEFGIEIMNMIVLSDGDPTDDLNYIYENNKVDLINSSSVREKIFLQINDYYAEEISGVCREDCVQNTDVYFYLVGLYKKLYGINTIHFDLSGNVDQTVNILKRKGFSDINNNKAELCFEVESKKLSNYYDSYYVVDSNKVFDDNKLDFSSKTTKEMERYVTSENSIFRVRSMIMRKFCEIISKKILT